MSTTIPVPLPQTLPVLVVDRTGQGLKVSWSGSEIDIDPGTSGGITSVTVSGPPIVLENAIAQFVATVKGSGDLSVTWAASDGAITQNGLFSAPSKVEKVVITATSNQDPTKVGRFTVSIALPSNTVQISPTGGNDTANWLAKWNEAIAAGKIVEVLAGNYSLSPLHTPAGLQCLIDDEVTASDVAGYGPYDRMIWIDAANVKFTGSGGPKAGLITTPNCYAKNLTNPDENTNQYNDPLHVEGASGVLVSGLRFDKCGGDGIYIAKSSSVVIRANVVTNPIRNACSVTDQLQGVMIDSNDFSKVDPAPLARIDQGLQVEPNGTGPGQPIPGQFISGLVITNNLLHDTVGFGLGISLYFVNSTTPIDITASNNRANKCAKGGYLADSWPHPMNGAVKGSGNQQDGQPVSFPN